LPEWLLKTTFSRFITIPIFAECVRLLGSKYLIFDPIETTWSALLAHHCGKNDNKPALGLAVKKPR